MSFIKSCFRTNANYRRTVTTDFPNPTLCICIGTNRARIRSSGAGRCITTHGNRITWSLSRGTALLCAAVLHIAERRTGWRTPSGCMLCLRSGWRRSCRAAQPLSALWRRSGASAPVADADFLVLSGTGLHIYYVFQQPIDLYPNIKNSA